MPDPSVRRSYLTLIAVCTSWGTVPLLARQVDLPPAAIVFVRVWVAAVALGVLLAVRRSRATGPVEDRPPLDRHRRRAVVAGLLLAVHWTTMFAAYRRAPDDTAVFIIFLAPVGVALLAPRTLGEAVGRRTLVALGIAVAGFVLVAGPSVRAAGASGVGFAAVSSATFVALVLLAKPLAEVFGGVRLTTVEMVVAGVALLPVAVTLDWGPPRADWAWLVVLGTVHTAVAISLYLSALARVPATHVGILGYLEPVAVVVLSWLFLSDPPRLTTLAGGALIIAAGTLVILQPEVPARVPG